MTVDVGTTTVIDDGFKLQNIAGANGNYDNFSANIQTVTNAIDFNTPAMTALMTGDVTFAYINVVAGKSAMLLLDISSDSHTPSFLASVTRWSSGTEPTWGDYRFWQIMFQVDASNVSRIMATAVGYESTSSGGGGGGETVSLIGTQSTPVNQIGLSNENTGGTTFGWAFAGDGRIIETNTNGTGSTVNYGNWCSNNPPQNSYWIRFTTNAGEVIDENISADLNIWHALTSSRSAKWSMGYQVFYGGSVKVEIATDSAGSTIVATGYYGIEIESGE